jgi:hypothetical protein
VADNWYPNIVYHPEMMTAVVADNWYPNIVYHPEVMTGSIVII